MLLSSTLDWPRRILSSCGGDPGEIEGEGVGGLGVGCGGGGELAGLGEAISHLLAQSLLHELQLPIVLDNLLLLLRVDRVQLRLQGQSGRASGGSAARVGGGSLRRSVAGVRYLEEGHVAPALQVASVLHIQVRLEPLVFIHERRPYLLGHHGRG